jgi:hypothetical protein
LVGRLFPHLFALLPLHYFAGVTVYLGLQAYSADYSTVFGPLLLGVFVVMLALLFALGGATIFVWRLAPDRGAAPPEARSVWLRALFAGLTALGCGLLFAAQPSLALATRKPPVQKPAAIATNPCALLSVQALKTAVPNAGPINSTGKQELSDAVKWTCVIVSTGEKPFGQLNISVTRLGSTVRLTAQRRAAEQYENYRNVYLDELATGTRTADVLGLGDEAVGVARDTYVHVYVRRGSDLVDVRYTASPSTVDRMLAAAAQLTREVLGGLR